jgi:hypothetical protein
MTVFLGQDTGVMKLDAVTQVYAVLSHSWFLYTLKLDVLMVLFDPGLNGTLSLSNIDPPTLTEKAVYARCFQAKVILGGPKESDENLLRWDAYSFNIIFG